MILAAAAVIIGLVLLVWSADLFVAGAASIAENLGLSPVIIGLTIVSLGTSAPEILVSITAALAGAGELAVGNALGSNIANIGMVLGITVLVVPMLIRQGCIRVELPTLLLVTLGTWALLLDGLLSRFDGLLMLGGLALILVQLVRAQAGNAIVREESEDEELPHLEPPRAWLAFLAGLAILVASSRLLVWGATSIAIQLGVSELVIGLTIIAVGTSLPELAATLASALKGHTEIAIGNIIGSNLFNLLAVMSMSGVIEPLTLSGEVLGRDYPAMAAGTFLLAIAIYTGHRHRRAEGGYSYLGRTVGLLLTSFYALYYYALSLSL
ncbi:calcium/sodium antiporter [Pseudohaliea rubra]|uniref:Inner membrane protein YrbG, predicted calcium/sodium:proton antiporter n=1 Tax=Pseudohaliea rubra DSM 19751 TaxID=1265313 RepID=A0A095WX90_9GAMM|nr:calcium/sodium antiporter [Pseudohaliea rubra]KGE03229.1 Inner membrane protein YrbG, predicted calcium/sodium:proton antiporter [Pseudohaliea rubra DSM 19751]